MTTDAAAVPSFEGLYDALEDERPLDVDDPRDRALYVAELHKVDGINPADELRFQVGRAKQGATWFFTGHRGVGKSTELRRIAHELRGQHHVVVVADMGEYLNLAEEISVELLLLTMMAALSDGFERQFGGQPLERGFIARLRDYVTRTKVEVEQITMGLSGPAAKADVKAVLKDDPTLRERIVRAAKAALGEFVAEVRLYAKEVVEYVCRHRPGARVVLVLDSLERLRVSGLDAAKRYDAIQQTFETYADFLKFDDLCVVYSIPPYLPYLAPKLGSYYGVGICTLPHVKVFERPLPGGARDAAYRPGIDFMLDALLRRCPAAERVIERALLERLAIASSGSVRDFFRLIREVCIKALLADEAVPLDNPRWALAAEQQLRSEMPLAEEDVAWLRKVRQTHGTGLDKIDNLPKLARLFDRGVILGYRNSVNWCDVHFLLREEVDRSPAES